jgi:hypothetical protein
MATVRWIQKWLWGVHGLTCQETTHLAAKAMDQPLTIGEHVKLFLHSLLCGYCRNYARQLQLLRKWARRVSAPFGRTRHAGGLNLRIKRKLDSENLSRRMNFYLMPTTIESGPTRCSTRVWRKPTWRIHPSQSAPV